MRRPQAQQPMRLTPSSCSSSQKDIEEGLRISSRILKRNGEKYVGTLNLLRWGQHPIDRDNIKSHGSPHIGEEFGDILVGFWWGLRWFKKVLVAILGPSL